jgi:hypothetical protein
MPRPSTLSTDDFLAFTKSLRDLGVNEFEFKGLRVKFEPNFRQFDMADMNKQELSQAMERFKQTDKDGDDLIDWST